MIGNNIAYYRTRLNLSQGDFAKKLKLRQSTVSRWESDLRNPTLKELVIISSILKIEIWELFMDKNKKKNTIEVTYHEKYLLQLLKKLPENDKIVMIQAMSAQVSLLLKAIKKRKVSSKLSD